MLIPTKFKNQFNNMLLELKHIKEDVLSKEIENSNSFLTTTLGRQFTFNDFFSLHHTLSAITGDKLFIP